MTLQLLLFLYALKQKLFIFILLIFCAWARNYDGLISPPSCNSRKLVLSLGKITILFFRKSSLRFLNLKACSAWQPLMLNFTSDNLSIQSDIFSIAFSASSLLAALITIFLSPALRQTSPSLRAAISLILMILSLLRVLSSSRQFWSTLQSILINFTSDLSLYSSFDSLFTIVGVSTPIPSTILTSIISGCFSSSLDDIESSESTWFQVSPPGVMAYLSSLRLISSLGFLSTFIQLSLYIIDSKYYK